MDNHTKYSREVTPNIEESLSKIAAKITPNSIILDIGCSSGMMGRYLVSEKGCIVDGVDIDEQALANCKPAYRKIAIKNLEIDDLCDIFAKESYDFIIVADVIEHLNVPDRLLQQLRLLVKPYGTIIFSVPNITHIAVSLELLLGNFGYRRNGLLDSTHLRFYSYANLETKLNDSGLYSWDVDAVKKGLCETEFGIGQSKLFPQKWLEELIATRPDALVYQWIVSTKIYPRLEQQESHPATMKISTTPVFTTTLYWESNLGTGFNETDKIIGIKARETAQEQELEYIFRPMPPQIITGIRIDPVSEQKLVWIKSAKLIDAEQRTLWEWTGNTRDAELINAKWVDAPIYPGGIMRAENEDPQWFPEITSDVLQHITAGIRCSIVMCDDNQIISAVLAHILTEQAATATQNTAERDAQIANLHQGISERDAQIANLHQGVSERDAQIANLHQGVSERDAQIANLHQGISERDAQIANAIAERGRIFNSTSWKITQPLRGGHRIVSNGIRRIWLNLPLQTRQKQQIKRVLFSNFPLLFSWSQAYRDWQAMSSSDNESPQESASQAITQILPLEVDPKVSTICIHPPKDLPVRMIAFYLPQFHAIPENNAWWGEGFTEWSNVKPAQPQFVGHYQPHIPGELGYYDLLDSSVQRRQIELAKLYGVGGFCFYSYWFGGKLLLEKPIENYLKDESLDLPFCLCWANENWSRRWDGLDNDILIAQNHSPEDDLGFIQHVAQFMRDKRYIRIDGKPLLLVYRPNLLPAAKESAQRWRQWCSNNGIGEIFLAYTQSFEAVSPNKYGFDAAIEFPPNNSAPPNVTGSVSPLSENFAATVYDWRILVERSRQYKPPSYKLFRGVCPSWDNTARKKNQGIIFLNSTPLGYQEWLTNAVIETCRRTDNPQERIVFVNAWNEWAEGAHLEPDQRYGYAYLEANRLALVRSAQMLRHREAATPPTVAIVLHAFYDEVVEEILEILIKINSFALKLYVTTTADKEQRLRALLSTQPNEYQLRIVENRGRDILPFMKIMPDVIEAGHEFLVKIHTKKSLHRTDGNEWRKDLLQKLLDNDALAKAMEIFKNDPHVGILGPDGHLVLMNYFWGANASRVTHIASRMGVQSSELASLNFVAGSMFIARVDSLVPLMNIALDDNEFESEQGQLDGTLAHAIERLFSVSAKSVGLNTTSPNNVALSQYDFVKN